MSSSLAAVVSPKGRSSFEGWEAKGKARQPLNETSFFAVELYHFLLITF